MNIYIYMLIFFIFHMFSPTPVQSQSKTPRNPSPWDRAKAALCHCLVGELGSAQNQEAKAVPDAKKKR